MASILLAVFLHYWLFEYYGVCFLLLFSPLSLLIWAVVPSESVAPRNMIFFFFLHYCIVHIYVLSKSRLVLLFKELRLLELLGPGLGLEDHCKQLPHFSSDRERNSPSPVFLIVTSRTKIQSLTLWENAVNNTAKRKLKVVPFSLSLSLYLTSCFGVDNH